MSDEKPNAATGMNRWWQWRRKLQPTHPLYADSRVGGLTLSFRAKLTLILLILVLIIGAMYLFHLNSVSNARHAQRVKDDRAQNQSIARIAALEQEVKDQAAAAQHQAYVNAQGLRTLACSLTALVDPQNFPSITVLGAAYACPPFGSKYAKVGVPPPNATGQVPGITLPGVPTSPARDTPTPSRTPHTSHSPSPAPTPPLLPVPSLPVGSMVCQLLPALCGR